MGTVYLLLGGDTGDRKRYLQSALERIEVEIGKVIRKSSIYETDPWGFQASTSFLNQVLMVQTELTPRETLIRIKKIEKQLGRTKTTDQYESRVIDIDILTFDNLLMKDKGLVIPHPRMHLRKFTLVPLAEIAGSLKHPVFNLDMETLNRECTDELKVELFPEQ